MKSISKLAVIVVALGSVSVAHAGLIDRGFGFIYDDVLDITWTQKAFLQAETSDWSDAVSWADSLVYGGYDDWRLPSMDRDGDGDIVNCNLRSQSECMDNELGYQYFWNLSPSIGSKTPLLTDLTGDQGPFFDISSSDGAYWSSTLYSSDPDNGAWGFSFLAGFNSAQLKDYPTEIGRPTGWAVRDGDVTPVPEPGAIALFGIGLAAMGLSRRRKKACVLRITNRRTALSGVSFVLQRRDKRGYY